MEMRFIKVSFVLLVCAVMSFQVYAAETFGFMRITSNSPENVAGQLFVTVSDAGNNEVSFRFTNNVGIASSITDVYFDNRGGLLDESADPVMTIASSDGAAFSVLATPGSLPSQNPVGFDTTQGLSADSDSPGTSANGVDGAIEWLTLTLTLSPNFSYNDVINALNSTTHDLWVGLHVQSIGSTGNSDGYVNLPSYVIPAPGAVLLAGLGTTMVGVLRRRR
ncbi:MAG TPA: hypothetical protein ENN22_02410 [bacterium]|nr:hypothetical protein [bacterium]